MSLAALLACMATLSWTSEPACLDVASLGGLDDGQEVLVRGLLVDLRTNDAGSESLVLADRTVMATVWVFVEKALGPPPSSFADIGDELRVAGNLAISRAGATLFSNSDSVSLMMEAEHVLTVQSLSSHWELFLGDEVSLRGILVQKSYSEGPRLLDLQEDCSLAVRATGEWDIGLLGLSVAVSGRLMLDECTMTIVLEAHSIHA